jgi:hypothetical protein
MSLPTAVGIDPSLSEASLGEGIVQRGNYWGSRGHNDSVWEKGKVRYAHGT